MGAVLRRCHGKIVVAPCGIFKFMKIDKIELEGLYQEIKLALTHNVRYI